MHPTEDDDLPLVRKAQAGDFQAFEALVGKYTRTVYGLALRIVGHSHDAEEVVQQTFLSLIEHIQGFREESRFSTWLRRIAANHALHLIRRRKVRKTVPLSDAPTEEGYGDLPYPEFIAVWRDTTDAIVGRRETQRLLDEALQELDEKYRVVFLLRDVEGNSTAETAKLLEISEANVKVRLLRARLMLRERLTRHFGDENQRLEPHRHEGE